VCIFVDCIDNWFDFLIAHFISDTLVNLTHEKYVLGDGSSFKS
jgi:hypothetical protein